jgi:hypothetical protein
MTSLLFIIGFVAYCFGDGFSDGRFKLLNTEAHWTKWPPRIGVAIMLMSVWLTPPSLLLLVGLIAFKPLFDIGWGVGNKQKNVFYIGTTDWTDRLLHKWGLVKLEQTKVPIISFAYLVLIFIGLLTILESFRTTNKS